MAFEQGILDSISLLISMHGISFIALTFLGFIVYIQKRRLVGLNKRITNLENAFYEAMAIKKEFHYED